MPGYGSVHPKDFKTYAAGISIISLIFSLFYTVCAPKYLQSSLDPVNFFYQKGKGHMLECPNTNLYTWHIRRIWRLNGVELIKSHCIKCSFSFCTHFSNGFFPRFPCLQEEKKVKNAESKNNMFSASISQITKSTSLLAFFASRTFSLTNS